MDSENALSALGRLNFVAGWWRSAVLASAARWQLTEVGGFPSAPVLLCPVVAAVLGHQRLEDGRLTSGGIFHSGAAFLALLPQRLVVQTGAGIVIRVVAG